MSLVRVHNFAVSLDGFWTGEGQRREAPFGRWGPGVGVEIMGRNKFGPQRGPWENEDWKGWWGDNPVFHTPVVVLTHHSRPVLQMDGGTTFHFVDADPVSGMDSKHSKNALPLRRPPPRMG